MTDSTNRELGDQIDALDRSVTRVHETLKQEGIKRDKRIRTNRFAIGIATIAAVIGIGVGAVGIRASDDANAVRDVSRIASCLQYNDQQAVQIQAEIKESHDLLAALEQASTDPDRVAKVALYNEKHDALIVKAHPDRDCSPAGIDEYLSKTKK